MIGEVGSKKVGVSNKEVPAEAEEPLGKQSQFIRESLASVAYVSAIDPWLIIGSAWCLLHPHID